MRLISFLGTGDYEETRYSFNRQEHQTRYVAAALSALLQANEITILATQEAKAKHWQKLQDEMSQLDLPTPNICCIPSGGNPEELWQQFESIREAVIKDIPSEVTFDITHGFRAQPFFAAAIINYLRVTLKDAPKMQVVYGEYRKRENDSLRESPIWDLSPFITLLDWSNALQSFITTGHGGALAKLASSENARIHKSSNDNHPKNLKSLADGLGEFSANIATVRCQSLIINNTRGSANNVLKLIEKSQSEIKEHLKPLAPVLDLLRERLQDIPAPSLFGESGHKAMSALAKLYLEYERYPEALITMREGWISLYADESSKVNNEMLLNKKKRENTEAKFRQAEGDNARIIADVRNDIEHGGFREQPKPAKTLCKQTKELIDAFEKAQPKTVTIAPISKTYFISRHPGAMAWAESKGFHIDQCLTHFDVSTVQTGDTILGTLPINLVAEVNQRGGRYFHLTLELPTEARGKELTANDMQAFGARLEEFVVKRK
jgi:CRISPR-associated protein Csx16